MGCQPAERERVKVRDAENRRAPPTMTAALLTASESLNLLKKFAFNALVVQFSTLMIRDSSRPLTRVCFVLIEVMTVRRGDDGRGRHSAARRVCIAVGSQDVCAFLEGLAPSWTGALTCSCSAMMSSGWTR